MPCDRSRGCGGAKTMQVIFILWLREVKKYTRSRTQIIASLGSPIMYLGILGFGLGPIFQKAGQGSYLQFMAPGVIGMTLLFTSMFSGIALLWDRQFGFLKETLVAPVPRLWIMGETQEERILQFLEENDTTVAGLREGAMVRVENATTTLKGSSGARIFRKGQAPVERAPLSLLDDLFAE